VLISEGTPLAKAAHWVSTDAEARKPGERTGLDTPVVLAVNVEYWLGGGLPHPDVAKALSTPPGEYGRKAETQRN
jgi:hypothetical protein